MNELERRLIDHPVFQRLRRIRQLAWTDFIYPGAMHTRFEHSIGVMHVAGLLYDAIVRNSGDVLNAVYGPSRDGTAWQARERQKVRLAALLHDVGHSPFSHASEDLFPLKGHSGRGSAGLLFPDMEAGKRRYKHEDYSIALIEHEFREAIETDDFNRKNFNITANEITDLLSGRPDAGPTLFWREILSNQLDADRMDYLLRDSHHLGVNYGKYDLHRLSGNVCAFASPANGEEARVSLGVLRGGVHAAESLIVARYSMFKQVYFHKTRMAFDIHLQGAMAKLLPGGEYPPPEPDRLKEYLRWDDWHVQGLLAEGKGGDDAERMLTRRHYRMVFSTRDRLVPPKEKRRGLDLVKQEEKKLEMVRRALGDLLAKTKTSKNSWYKGQEFDIAVIDEYDRARVQPLSFYSAMAELNCQDQYLLYVKPEDVVEARARVAEALRGFEDDAANKVKARNSSEKAARAKKAPKKMTTAKSNTRPRSLGKVQPIALGKGEKNAG
jgi:HD superfamily phosphohydrolase